MAVGLMTVGVLVLLAPLVKLIVAPVPPSSEPTVWVTPSPEVARLMR
jgi:hypothetical protein